MAKTGLINRLLASLATIIFALAAVCLSGCGVEAKSSVHLRFARSHTHPDILVMLWNGPIRKPMSEEISTAFEDNKASVKAVELKCRTTGTHRTTPSSALVAVVGIRRFRSTPPLQLIEAQR